MTSETGIIAINKDQYYKAYLDQRQKLHVHLVQQLLAKSEVKKQIILTKSAEIIDNFTKYRDAFLMNMPSDLKATKVSDYMARGAEDLQEASKMSSEKALAGIYKMFQSEFEKAHGQPKKNGDAMPATSTACHSGKKIKLISKDKAKRYDAIDKDGVSRQLTDITNEPHRIPHEESHQYSGMKSKTKQENGANKTSKKRKWDQFGSNMKENKNPLNYSNSKQQNNDIKFDMGKLQMSDKKNPVLSVISMNRLNTMTSTGSPKKPWMP